MSRSYTPGLKVAGRMSLEKKRILPIAGEVLVQQGNRVGAEQVVANTELPGDVYPVNVAAALGISPAEVAAAMLHKPGDFVREGERLAQASSFFGLFKSQIDSPKAATIENISTVTGQVILRGNPLPVEVKAYLPGLVTEVMPQHGVTICCEVAYIQGIFGIGGETYGSLRVLVSSPGDVLEASLIKEEHRGCLIVGGSLVTAQAIRRAEEVGVSGIVVGGIDDRDLRDYLGYDLGVAITGNEDIGLTVVVTEGFGRIEMASKTYRLLKEHEGERASINGTTQIRAGVLRPEVIIPLEEGSAIALSAADKVQTQLGLDIGSMVRCIRSPYFGQIGTVRALPQALMPQQSGTMVRVLQVEFADGNRVMVPRANVEVIESL